MAMRCSFKAHSVLDDVLHNIISDILMKTHRDEKTAKANTAALRVEKMASDASESSSSDSRPEVRVETDAAIYEDGRVLLKGNPLKTTKEILCPKCQLPRLLHPTDGKGARKPDPTIVYCKKQPYIKKAGCDIYGQSWIAQGPGRGKKKKDMAKGDPATDPSTPSDQRPPNVLSFPSATCSKCKRCILVTRLNNHMASCIGNSGRNASRAAAQKINGNGSGNDVSNEGGSSNGTANGPNAGFGTPNNGTPPSSQKPTPAPGSRTSSPKKRDASDEDDDSETSHKKKKLKASGNTKKVILKSKPSFKKEKIKAASSLSQEQKVGDNNELERAVGETPPKKPTAKSTSPAKKLKSIKPPLASPAAKNGLDGDMESESSGTLSSPPAAAAQ